MGINKSIEREGQDRYDIQLPADQREFLQEIYKVNPNIIVVLVAGSSLAVNWMDEHIPAIVNAWYPGEQGGTAVADVLFGDFNPSGKLPVTFYKNTEQLPDFEDYSMKGRTYRYMTDKPLFPFGYGLSYATFDVSKGRLSKSSVMAGEGVKFTVQAKNTGNRDGAEVVQVYVRKVGDTEGPLKSLRGFRRVDLKAGESRTVSIELSPDAFEFFDTSTNTMRVVPGEYEIMYGNSSDTPEANKLTVVLR